MAGEQAPRRRLRPARGFLVAVAVLIPAIPVAIGIAIGFGAAGATPAASTVARFTPAGPTSTRGPAGPATAGLPVVPGGSGAIVALVLHSTTLRAAPHGRPLARLSTHTDFGSPEALWVVRRVPGWLGVVAPQAGNGRLGWLPQSAASLSRVAWQLKISLTARRLTVLHAGKVTREFTAAIGRPDAPTPTGRFAVTDRLLTGNPAGPYGCCILALSAHSPHTIQGWTGGDRIAVHSTPDTSTIGKAVSHGCVRVTLAEGRWLLAHIPLGTPTLISG